MQTEMQVPAKLHLHSRTVHRNKNTTEKKTQIKQESSFSLPTVYTPQKVSHVFLPQISFT